MATLSDCALCHQWVCRPNLGIWPAYLTSDKVVFYLAREHIWQNGEACMTDEEFVAGVRRGTTSWPATRRRTGPTSRASADCSMTWGTRPSTARSGRPRHAEERSPRGVRPQVAVPQRLRRGARTEMRCRTLVYGDLVGELEARLQDVIDSCQPGMWREYIADLVAAETRILWHDEFERLQALAAVVLQAWWVTHPTQFREHLQEFGKLSRPRDKETHWLYLDVRGNRYSLP